MPDAQFWKDGGRIEAQRLIDALLAAKLPGGWPVGQDFDVPLIELAESASPRFSREEIWRLLDALSKSGEQTVDALERLWNERSNAPLTEPREWRFWLPLEIAPRSSANLPTSTIILGTTFLLESGHSVRATLATDLAKLRDYTGRRDRAPSTPTFVSFVGKGEHFRAAWSSVEPAWDTYRGLAAFIFGRGKFRILGGGPRSAALQPSWMLARTGDLPLQFEYFLVDYDPSRRMGGEVGVDEGMMGTFRDLAAPFAGQLRKDSTLGVVADCLRLYAQAMDSGQDHTCFLGLWQLAEAITMAEESGGKTERVAARLGPFLDFPPVGARRTLKYLARRRNRMVHHGILAMEHEDLNLLQFACEGALGWLMQKHELLPTRLHLREYYRSRSLGNKELSAIVDTVARIIEGRQKGR